MYMCDNERNREWETGPELNSSVDGKFLSAMLLHLGLFTKLGKTHVATPNASIWLLALSKMELQSEMLAVQVK